MSHHTEGKVIASTAHIWNWFETNTKENQFWSREIAMLVNSLWRIIIQRHTQHRYSFFKDWLLGHAHPITKTLSLSCKHYFWDRVSLCSTTETTLQYLNQCESRLCSAHFIPGFCCCVGLLCVVRQCLHCYCLPDCLILHVHPGSLVAACMLSNCPKTKQSGKILFINNQVE